MQVDIGLIQVLQCQYISIYHLVLQDEMCVCHAYDIDADLTHSVGSFDWDYCIHIPNDSEDDKQCCRGFYDDDCVFVFVRICDCCDHDMHCLDGHDWDDDDDDVVRSVHVDTVHGFVYNDDCDVNEMDAFGEDVDEVYLVGDVESDVEELKGVIPLCMNRLHGYCCCIGSAAGRGYCVCTCWAYWDGMVVVVHFCCGRFVVVDFVRTLPKPETVQLS
eukprot:631746_1